MDLNLTEEQRLIADTARELLTARAGVAGTRALGDDPAGYSAELWKELVELGWCEAEFTEACLIIEQLGAARVPSPYPAALGCVAPVLAAFGTAEQAALVGEGRVLSYAFTPPGGELATLSGGLLLRGAAEFVPFGGSASDVLVVAVGPGDGERTAVLVDATAAGVARTPLAAVGDDRPCHLTFADVAVPAGRVVGGIGKGAAVAGSLALHGAAATCAEMVGGAQRVLDLTVDYAGTRAQFGRPIGSFQAVQHHCANMTIDVLGARYLAYEAIWRVASGDAGAELTVAAAKAWCSDAYQRVCDLGHQVHGAIGFTEEHDLHLYLRHATATALAFGDGDEQTDRVADAIGLPQ
ncbi:acyl-CoA dehydrogenase family protein [Pseudonocardia eucalypti]|uniref:Acyl-CoA dehydrogenase family protein n=1 Tax=Pseudonocardia eucalypti TaxID=648755 RepID=A0ABP9PEH0_9PSEU|nr:alkylation response protein AidB-like acyl-CoA dehydrogenase [Pseudonocardia eucalypti]